MCHEQSTNSRSKWMVAIFSFCILLAGGTFGAEPVQVPEFSVQRMDGSASKTSDWSLQGKWLLIYVERRSDALLRRLTQQEYSQLGSRTIIVVGGMQLREAQVLQSKFPQLAGVSWFADAPRNAPVALKLQGAPMIIGIQDRTVRWRINGFPRDAKLLHSLLTTWTAQ